MRGWLRDGSDVGGHPLIAIDPYGLEEVEYIGLMTTIRLKSVATYAMIRAVVLDIVPYCVAGGVAMVAAKDFGPRKAVKGLYNIYFHGHSPADEAPSEADYVVDFAFGCASGLATRK